MGPMSKLTKHYHNLSRLGDRLAEMEAEIQECRQVNSASRSCAT